MSLDVLTDLRHAARSLGRSPGFGVAAIVTIALAVGLNTGIFSVINGVLFRDLPVPHAEDLVSISQAIEGTPARAGSRGAFSTAEYRAYRDRAQTLSHLMGYSDPSSAVLGGAAQRQIGGLLVTCNYFAALEQPPLIGRALAEEDCRTGADPVVVLGYDVWRTTFSADATIVGRELTLNRQVVTVVGVAREDTYSSRFAADFFVPISAEALLYREGRYADGTNQWLSLIGRRTDGASTAQVRAELAVIAAQIDRESPGRSTTLSVERAKPNIVPAFVRGPALGGAAVIMTAFSFILVIACANLANLMLARGATKHREFAVRRSLGASRAHLIRQLLTESLLLAGVGGVLGSLLAWWSFRALLELAMPVLVPVGLPRLALDTSPDVRVLIVTLALTLGTGVAFGLAPALQAAKTDLQSAMKKGFAGGGSHASGRLQGALLGVQVALSMMLIIGAGLLLRGSYVAQRIDPGYDADAVTVLSYDYVTETGHEDDPGFWRALREEIAALPGVEGAAYAAREPLGDDFGLVPLRLPAQSESEAELATLNAVGEDYFSVVGLRITAGRGLVAADADTPAVVVSEATAKNLWGDAEPLGQTLLWRGRDREREARVVGVVADGQVSALGRVDPYYVYIPTREAEKLLVRSGSSFAATAEAIRGVVRRLDTGLPAPLYPLEANLDRWQGLSGLATSLAGALGGLALVLAAVGIFGVVSYFVARRFREIGIRLALGARAASVYGLVLARTMRPLAVGAIAGVGGAVAGSGILSAVLFGVSPLDPLGVGGAAVFVLAVALAAAAGATRRAARVDPMVTLRYE